jgi:hypothetical protein
MPSRIENLSCVRDSEVTRAQNLRYHSVKKKLLDSRFNPGWENAAAVMFYLEVIYENHN